MTITTSPSDPWELTYDDLPDEEFVDGLRLSIDCVCCRLIAPLDPDRYHDFPECLGNRGHGFERILQEWMRKKFGVQSHRELVVPWAYGESHLDLFLPVAAPAFDAPGSLQIELKANREAQVKPENVRQMHRQMYAVELAADAGKQLRYRSRDADGEWRWHRLDPMALLEAQWRLVVIDPGTWRVPDPRGVQVRLTDERRAELAIEWQHMADFMQLSAGQRQWNINLPHRMPACTCGKCFRPELQELDEECAEHAALYLEAQQEAKFAQDAQNLERDWLLERLSHGLPDGEGAPFAGNGYAVTISKPTAKGTRSVRVRESDAKAVPLL